MLVPKFHSFALLKTGHHVAHTLTTAVPAHQNPHGHRAEAEGTNSSDAPDVRVEVAEINSRLIGSPKWT